jgi:hypothetical protein
MGAWPIGTELGGFAGVAATTGYGLDDLNLFALVGYLVAADEDEAPVAQGAFKALEAAVVRLYGLVIVMGLRYSVGVHSVASLRLWLWAGSRGGSSSCGATSFSSALILYALVSICNLFCFIFASI